VFAVDDEETGAGHGEMVLGDDVGTSCHLGVIVSWNVGTPSSSANEWPGNSR
jgi:hypothetical protein